MSRLDNIKHVFRHRRSFVVGIVAALGIGAVMYYFTDFSLVAGNMGLVHAVTEVVTEIILAVLFGFNMALLWHQLHSSAQVNSQEAGAVTLGSVAGIIVSGCPACGITLASYVGLASVFSSLPFYGLELKVFGILLLIYSSYSISGKLGSCELNIEGDDDE